MKAKLFIACFAVLAIGYVMIVNAGNLNPVAAPGSTMKTLDEIFAAVAPVSPNETFPLPEQAKVEQADFIQLTLRGETQGQIHGSCQAVGREDTITVEAYSHEVVTIRDAASGLLSGKRQHKPVTITKRIDKSTPLLYNSLINNENLPEVKFEFYRKTKTGSLEQYYTVELINASVAEISQGSRDQESISFTYQKIIWTWVEGGVSAEDDWEAPIV